MAAVHQIEQSPPAVEAMGMTRSLSSDEFRAVIGHFASGVTVITTVDAGVRHGTTASAVSSLSLEPPMLLICMNTASATGQAIASAGRFAVNVLSEHQSALALRFAKKGADKFADVAVMTGGCGQPLLEEALAHLECRVTETVRAGTHMVFLAEVETATARTGSPLTYYRGQFGRLDPARDEDLADTLRGWLGRRQDLWGQTLDVAEIAIELETTPGPLYLALGELATEGLVHPVSGGGFVITPVTRDVMEHALRARCAIDLGVADLTVGRVSAEQLAELRRAMEATLPLVEGDRFVGNFAEYPKVNDHFHEVMVALAGSPHLVRAYRRLQIATIFRETHRPPRPGPAVAALNADHIEIVEAYEAGDVDRARRALTRHTENVIGVVRLAMGAADADEARGEGDT